MDKETLQEIYDSLPTIDCKGRCHDQCTVAPAGKHEEQNIKAAHGESGIPEPTDELRCNQLTDDNRCGIHSERPLICRLFGLVKDRLMRCPHGCKPTFWLKEKKARQLMDIVIKGHEAKSNNQADSSFLRKVKQAQNR